MQPTRAPQEEAAEAAFRAQYERGRAQREAAEQRAARDRRRARAPGHVDNDGGDGGVDGGEGEGEGGAGSEDDDEGSERELDAFADKLAARLAREHAATAGGARHVRGGGDGDDDDDDDDEAMDAFARAYAQADAAGVLDEEQGEGGELEGDEGGGEEAALFASRSSDDELDEGSSLHGFDFGEEEKEDEESEEDEAPRGKRRKGGGGSSFADADVRAPRARAPVRGCVFRLTRWPHARRTRACPARRTLPTCSRSRSTSG